jgi:hypothetical protein
VAIKLHPQLMKNVINCSPMSVNLKLDVEINGPSQIYALENAISIVIAV